MEISKKAILSIIGAVFLLGVLSTPVFADLDKIEDSPITVENCEGSTVTFKFYTNSDNVSHTSTDIEVNGITKSVSVPEGYESFTATFLAENIIDTSLGTHTVTVNATDYSGISEPVEITVTECGVTCDRAPGVLDDVDYEDERAPEDTLSLEVSLDNNEGEKFHDVELKAWIEDENGVRLGDRKETEEFDLSKEEEEEKTLDIEIPDDADEGQYEVYLRASSDEGCLLEETYDLEITREEDSLKLDKVGFDSTINAGEDFSVAVTTLNNGQNDQEDVQATVEMEDLDLSQTSQYFDIEEDEKITQYFTLTIPENTEQGEYKLNIEVGNEETQVTKEYTVELTGEEEIEDEEAEVSASISAGETSKEFNAGEGNTFHLEVTNTGDKAETFEFSSAGTTGWATHSIEPKVATIGSGETESVYLYVSANEDAEEKEHSLTFYVKENGETVESRTLNAVVEGTEEEGAPELGAQQVGMWIFAIVIVIVAVLFGVWTYATKSASKKGKKGKEKYY